MLCSYCNMLAESYLQDHVAVCSYHWFRFYDALEEEAVEAVEREVSAESVDAWLRCRTDAARAYTTGVSNYHAYE